MLLEQKDKGRENKMKKSAYSIVLSDEVVEAIDAMAYSMNTSRSNLINQILAEKVSLLTPERRMKDIFGRIEQLMDKHFQLLDQPSDAMMSVKSPLKFKYKPTIKYSVELFRNFEGCVGRLKISFRTQSSRLINAINQFFEFWQKLENKYLSDLFKNGVPWDINYVNFTREFYSPRNPALSDDEIANAIGAYINLIDQCIKIFFENLDDSDAQAQNIEKTYREYLKKGLLIL